MRAGAGEGAPTRLGEPTGALLAALLGVELAAGVVHGLFSLYWGAGGSWLLPTIGRQMLEAFGEDRWLLVPVGLVKVGCAAAPVLLARHGLLARGPWRAICWLGATVLVAWGGLGATSALLVLGGAVRTAEGYDREGMIGHAYLWDPLFLLWGLSLAACLVLIRRRRA